jgi:ribosomal protein L37AE/L43A
MRAPLEHADPNCRETRSWRARDGNWRCSTCTPPAFPDEIVEEQP